jgi:plastocyanin
MASLSNTVEFLTKTPRGRVVGVAGIVAVVVAVVVMLNPSINPFQKHPADEDREVHDYEATMQITDQGFMPSTMTVKTKTRIYFENHGSKFHIVSPTEATPDDEFVSPREIKAGSGWAFTFIKPGHYRFHDGDNPTANGEIVVE